MIHFSATFAPYSSVNYRYTEKVRSLFGNQEQVTNYKQFWKFIEEDLVDGRKLTIPKNLKLDEQQSKNNKGLNWETNRGYKYRKSSIRSQPLIQVYSIRGLAIGGSVQAPTIGKSLNPSKLPYLDLYELLQIKNFALEIVIFEIPLIQVQGIQDLK